MLTTSPPLGKALVDRLTEVHSVRRWPSSLCAGINFRYNLMAGLYVLVVLYMFAVIILPDFYFVILIC